MYDNLNYARSVRDRFTHKKVLNSSETRIIMYSSRDVLIEFTILYFFKIVRERRRSII